MLEDQIPLLRMMDLKDECWNCSFFNPAAKDNYRCACLGSCPGVTLSTRFKEFILKKVRELEVQKPEIGNIKA